LFLLINVAVSIC